MIVSERIRSGVSGSKKPSSGAGFLEGRTRRVRPANGDAAEGVHRRCTTVAANPLRRRKKNSYKKNRYIKKCIGFLFGTRNFTSERIRSGVSGS